MNQNENPKDLARVLGLADAISIVIGSVIGSGIFIVPAAIALRVHSPALIFAVWLLGGALTFFGALCFSELGSMFPQAGGMYVYLREAYGQLPGFLFGWTLFLVIDSGSMATLASAFATKYLPYFVKLGFWQTRLVILAFIAFLTVVNYVGVRHGANLQNLLTAIKFVAIGAVVILVFVFAAGDATNFTAPSVEPFSWRLVGSFGAALIASLWAYKGWECVTFSTAEIKNPRRNLVLGLLIGSLLVIALYLAANAAYLYAFPAGKIAGSERIAADALSVSIGPVGASLVSALILFSILGAANSNILTSPRVFFAMAKDGVFFSSLAKVHPRFLTPHVAIIAMACWTTILAMTGTFEQLFAYVVFGQWIFFGLTVGAVLVLRKKRPDIERPVRVWGFPFTPIVFIAAAIFIAVSALVDDVANALIGLAIIGLGIPVFYVWRRRRAAAR